MQRNAGHFLFGRNAGHFLFSLVGSVSTDSAGNGDCTNSHALRVDSRLPVCNWQWLRDSSTSVGMTARGLRLEARGLKPATYSLVRRRRRELVATLAASRKSQAPNSKFQTRPNVSMTQIGGSYYGGHEILDSSWCPPEYPHTLSERSEGSLHSKILRRRTPQNDKHFLLSLVACGTRPGLGGCQRAFGVRERS